MEAYSITLKNERTRYYNRIAWLIIILNIALLIYQVFTRDRISRAKDLASLIILCVMFILKYSFRNTAYKIGLSPFLYVIAFTWISLEQYWLAGIVFVFYLLYTTSIRQLVVVFSKD